jgi:hypothetical protein
VQENVRLAFFKQEALYILAEVAAGINENPHEIPSFRPVFARGSQLKVGVQADF